MICANDGCENKFEPKTHNMKYCSDECCRVATNQKIKQKYYDKKARLAGKVRTCKTKGCETKLNRYNVESICENCLANEKAREQKMLLEMIKNVSR
jgi:hypothetical protein